MDEALLPYRTILDKKAFGFLSTLSKDGWPHLTPLWIKYEGKSGNFIINIEEKSIKDFNIRRNPRVCLNILDPDNPYHYLFVKGTVISRAPDDGSLVNYLYTKYSDGKHEKPWIAHTSPLLRVEIQPVKISGWGREDAYEFKEKLER